MNVLHVVASLGLRRGGVAASVRSLAQDLARLGMGVHIMTADRMREPSVDDSADAELRTSGVTLQYYPVSSSNWLGQRYAYSPALGKALARIIPTMDIVHLHGMWQYPALAAARVCRRAGIPYVLSPCGMLDPTGFRRHRVFKHLYGVSVERRTLAGAAAIHFTSTFEQRVAHLFGIHRPGMVVPCSIEAGPELLPPLGTFRRRYPAIGDRPILLFLGRIHAKKRPDLVAETFVTLANRYPQLWLVMAGPDDGAEASVRVRLREAGLLSRTIFTGFIAGAEKWAVLADSTIFVLPSKDENFGVSVVEAVAAGIPVIVSTKVGVAEFIARAGAGLVIDQDPAAWVAGVARLLDEPETCRAMAEAGRRLVATEFTSERVAASMRELYASAIQSHGA